MIDPKARRPQERLSDRVAILIPSCDKYSDLWQSVIQALRIRWPTCPFRLFLISNYLDCDSAGLETVKVGNDEGWSANLLTALTRIPHEYVFLFLDDLFLRSNVIDEDVVPLIQQAVDGNWDYLRLNPTPPPPRQNPNSSAIGRIPSGDLYRASTVLAVWKKTVLVDVLRPSESAWELEISGSSRTDKYREWFACRRWNLPYDNLVIKGKIDPLARKRIESQLPLLQTNRPTMRRVELLFLLLRRARSSLFRLVPRVARRRIRSYFSPS